MSDDLASRHGLADLLEVMARLRDPERGCPWDLNQTFATIAPHTLEECYELVDTIERSDFGHLREELGDLLFQVVFYAQMAAESGYFDFDEVIDVLTKKLLRRHPHVFPEGHLATDASGVGTDEATVNATWEAIKQAEREAKSAHGVLADVPLALPALSRAQKLQKRASRVGFDWDSADQVMVKVEEELAEVTEAMALGSREDQAEEVGDLLFAVVNLARHLQVDAESALRAANRKFEDRFRGIERRVAESEQTLQSMSLEQLDDLWERVKTAEREESRSTD